MKLRDHILVFRRAVKLTLLERRNRKYTVLLIVNAFLSSVIGYIPIYFSAKVIDSLVAGSPLETVVSYVLLTVGIVFAVGLLNTCVTSEKDAAERTMWRDEDWSFSEKAMQMAFRSTEDPEVTKLRYQVRRANQTGQNLFFLYQHIREFSEQVTKITASIALTMSFFTLSSVPAVFKYSIVAGLVATLIIQVYATKKTTKLDRDFLASSVEMNILSEHFLDYIEQYDAGKDIRLYDMGAFLGDSYLEIDRDYWERSLKNSYKKAAWTLPETILNTALRIGTYAVLIIAAMNGGVTIGSIAKYAACIILLAETLTQTVRTAQLALVNNHYLKDYFSYFDIPNEMYHGSRAVETREGNPYCVEIGRAHV